MPLETLRADVLAEIKREREARHQKAAEDRIDALVKALDMRLRRLEAKPAPALPDESFWKEVAAVFREYVEKRINQEVGRMKSENAALANRIKYLEDQPSLKYCGVWESGVNYPKNSLVTWDGSLWIARSTTGAAPGTGGSDWKMCVKRGRDGKDGKDAR